MAGDQDYVDSGNWDVGSQPAYAASQVDDHTSWINQLIGHLITPAAQAYSNAQTATGAAIGSALGLVPGAGASGAAQQAINPIVQLLMALKPPAPAGVRAGTLPQGQRQSAGGQVLMPPPGSTNPGG